MTIESILNKMLDNIIYAPVLGYFFTPIKTRVDKFLKSIWPWYVNSYYTTAAKNFTGRASVVSLFILMLSIFSLSEFLILSIWNPTIPIMDKALEANPEKTDRVILTIIFLFNILLFVAVMRIELISSSIVKFNQMLTIIRPDIKVEKYYELKRDWALMKSQDDYNKIIDYLFSNYPILIDKDKFPDEVKIFKKMKATQVTEGIA